ncbi:Fungal chitosanase [Caballeronia calidae]|uniref:Fungal chitosanase n=1 Tax=Caballeronia calidae TaxID=1777139 RepID=A0A158B7R3_9BURK|nr:glycoside hydrolase family 75 protein [Caballeronia calidae]SAK66121.1 Fungal chitosanase [Caballeronia calidae]
MADSFRQAFAACDKGNGKPQCDGNDLNRNTTILELNSGAILFDAKMAVDNDGSPFAGKWPSQPQTSLFYSDGRTSINADKIRYIAVPGGFDAKAGFVLGDVAAVIYRDKVAFALVADHSKSYRVGEGSVALHTALGHDGCRQLAPDGNCKRPRNDSIGSGVTYIVFPGTKAKICGDAPLPRSPSKLCNGLNADNLNQKVDEVGKEAFDALKSASK